MPPPYSRAAVGPSRNILGKVRSGPPSPPHDRPALSYHLPTDLPFLFKVLSVAKALSIQAHPDREAAKELHARDPKNYPDPNHKPEMTIALTRFEALCGFRPISEIVKSLEEVPELCDLAEAECVAALRASVRGGGEEVDTTASSTVANNTTITASQKQALKGFFAQFIAADRECVEAALGRLVARLTAINRPTTELEELCLRLNGQFPGEVGCFCVFLLNYLQLAPGEAVFLAANEPHAYLSGECIECMALSDNVVRAGLTPKFRDVQTLVGMLTYQTYQPSDLAMQPSKLAGRPLSLLYRPPVKEFAVARTSMSLGDTEAILTESTSEAIILIVRGDFTLTKADGATLALRPGSILLQDRGTTSHLSCCSQEGLVFQAFAQE